MMMARSRDFKRGSRTGRQFGAAALAVVALIVIFALLPSIAPYLRALYADLTSGRSSDPTLSVMTKNALIARIQSDETALSHIKYQTTLDTLLENENAELRNLAGAPAHAPGIAAAVVARPPETAYDVLILDAGSEEGIKDGDLALYQGSALGRVISVTSTSASVQLFSTAGLTEDIMIGQPPAILVGKGEGGGAFEAEAPATLNAAPGDLVRLSGSGSYAIGAVRSVSKQEHDVSETVYFSIPVSLADVDFVEILPSS